MALRRAAHRPAHGAAALIVVMLLFFVISMVAAYASRNLIFEQKTSANQYRATQAFEAAEAGLEWAIAMLNGGRIDADCAASTNVANNSFRARYLDMAPDTGMFAPRTWNNAGATEPLHPSCVRSDAGWICSCPGSAAPVLAAPGGTGQYPAFRISFEPVNQPGAVRVEAVGCTRLDENCLSTGQGSGGEAAARVSVVVAINSALATPPVAALTARSNIDVGAALLRLTNQDAATGGITAHAGGTVTLQPTQLRSVPGTPPEASIVEDDGRLAAFSPDQMFAATFRMAKGHYRDQGGAVVLSDCAGACSNKLLEAARDFPGRVIWVEGDMTIEADVVLGTAAEPVLIVSTGNIQLNAGSVQIVGLLYSQAVDLDNAGVGAVSIQGAVIAEGNFIGDGTPLIQYDPAILKTLRLGTGTMVRVPGSWRDF
jgi:PilX N-terminal